jgi:3-hydroxybutyryl-CoA dehydrogenase
MKLVEVIRAADTAQWVTDAMVALGKRQTARARGGGRHAGFLVNLGGTAIGTEGLRIIRRQGHARRRSTPSCATAAASAWGPFELMDLTGIDVNFPARKIIYEGFFHDRRMTPSPYHESLYAAGRLGRKTGGGWYGYDAKGAKIDPGADHVPRSCRRSSVVVMDSHNEKLVGLVMTAGAKGAGRRRRQEPDPGGADRQGLHDDGGRAHLDPRRTVAVDLTGDIAKRLTIMSRPGAHDVGARRRGRDPRPHRRQGDADQGLARLHRPAHVRHDRQLGCEMAMIGIASAADVDTAMTLGLNYPRGPLALADWLGVKDCHEDPGAIAGHHRRRPLPAEPVVAAPGAIWA